MAGRLMVTHVRPVTDSGFHPIAIRWTCSEPVNHFLCHRCLWHPVTCAINDNCPWREGSCYKKQYRCMFPFVLPAFSSQIRRKRTYYPQWPNKPMSCFLDLIWFDPMYHYTIFHILILQDLKHIHNGRFAPVGPGIVLRRRCWSFLVAFPFSGWGAQCGVMGWSCGKSVLRQLQGRKQLPNMLVESPISLMQNMQTHTKTSF